MIYKLMQKLGKDIYQCGQTPSLIDAKNWESKSPSRQIIKKKIK